MPTFCRYALVVLRIYGLRRAIARFSLTSVSIKLLRVVNQDGHELSASPLGHLDKDVLGIRRALTSSVLRTVESSIGQMLTHVRCWNMFGRMYQSRRAFKLCSPQRNHFLRLSEVVWPFRKIKKRSLSLKRRNKQIRSKLAWTHSSFSYGVQSRALQNLAHSNSIDSFSLVNSHVFPPTGEITDSSLRGYLLSWRPLW